MDIKVPFLADGIDSGTVVNILVAKGDTVKKDQILVELETEKAVAPIPSTGAGVVEKVHVNTGDKANVGQVVVTLSGSAKDAVSAAEKEVSKVGKPAVEVATPKAAVKVAQAAPQAGEYVYESKSGFAPPASPSIRKMAKELGIDLARVKGSENGGRIVESDLRAYIQRLQQSALQVREVASSIQRPVSESIDFSKWGSVSKKPMTSLRKKISQKMVESWTTIPHVTQFDEADITDLMISLKKHNPDYEKQGAKLTLTVFAMQAAVVALKQYPIFNSSMDEQSEEVVTKDYYHMGIAVDTDQGLIVPVLRDVDKKGLLELQKELNTLAEKTRQRKIGLDELRGGTFTISNQGGIGGGHFTPIINKPELGIIGLGRGAAKPVIRDGKIAERVILPVSLSYDHRLIDGGTAVRFVREFIHALETFKDEDIKRKKTK